MTVTSLGIMFLRFAILLYYGLFCVYIFIILAPSKLFLFVCPIFDDVITLCGSLRIRTEDPSSSLISSFSLSSVNAVSEPQINSHLCSDCSCPFQTPFAP